MNVLTHYWTVQQNVSQLLYTWGALMVAGVVITDLAILQSWGFVLLHLCDLWLILSAIGYVITGWMVHSRAFFLSAFIHFMTVFLLPLFTGWHFAFTGVVMMSNLFIFAEKQWDMLLPQDVVKYKYKYKGFSFRFDRFFPSFSYSLSEDILGKIFRHLILFVFI